MSAFSNALDWNLLRAAKNLILAGVKSVTLHDEGTVELWDLSSNFVFSENDLGKNRAVASVSKLQELNNAVLVLSLTTELTKEQLSNFQVLLLLLSTYFWSQCFLTHSYVYLPYIKWVIVYGIVGNDLPYSHLNIEMTNF
jgi:hypothetical protein